MDINISVLEGKIVTNIYRKETDVPRSLLPSSSHPGHVTQGIVYSMGYKLLRICSSEELFEEGLVELRERLVTRQYHPKIIDQQLKKVKDLPGDTYKEKRDKALEEREKTKNVEDRVIAVFTYNPRLPNIGQVLTKHWKAMILKSPELKTVFPAPPMAALRQGPNLRSYLCRSSLYPITTRSQRTNIGRRPCNKPRCGSCPFSAPATHY